EMLDRRRDAGRAEALVVFAPAHDTFVGRELDEAVVAPARVAMQRLDPGDFHRGSSPLRCRPGPGTVRPALVARMSVAKCGMGVPRISARCAGLHPSYKTGEGAACLPTASASSCPPAWGRA